MIFVRFDPVKIQFIIFIFVWLRKLALAKMPLIEETVAGPKLSQQTQCAFYKDIYEIGDKWKPNVEPFGVYHCILCECIAIRRKNQENVKVITKVKCRNFKNDCPKLTCANPILLPDRCCKTCPGDTNNLEDTIASQKLEESLALKNLRKKFFAFLTESSGGHKRFNLTAIGEKKNSSIAFLHLNKQRLAFIIKIKSPRKPSYVRFQDMDDTIIEEYIVKNKSINHHHHHNEFMVYGSWTNMAKPYRVMIRKSQLKISVSFSVNINVKSVLHGIIKKYNIAAQELLKNQTNYFDVLEGGHFGKGKFFDEMFNTTSFVAYQENNYIDRKALMDQSTNSIDSNYKCYYEAQIYEEGAQWKNQNDECEMCFCQRGRVKCESEICLKLRCKEQIRVPGQCCPICKNNLAKYSSYNQSCYFEGEKKYHLIGTKWHPFIPPFGFDRCTVCMCTDNAQIKCKRNECPTLPCSEKDSYRENPMDCCKKCRASTKSFELTDTMNDQASTDDNVEQALMTGSCRFRGKIYANGHEWNPAVYPFGEISCIKCNCKDGKHKCQRLECKPTPPSCLKIIKKNECCPTCANQTSTENGRKRFPMIRF